MENSENVKSYRSDNSEDKPPLDESSVTMLDVLEEEKVLEEEYAAVLGACDDKVCTYSQGAVKRQGLYSCLTCCPEARTDMKKSAGVCLACSYQCHENHELIELYTKRNFRCDCPTERMGTLNKCRLNPELQYPAAVVLDNLYNQNFQGLYCNCNRPYPDPERTSEEVMFQCTICEDWYHLHHLDCPPNSQKLMDACEEMICDGCMEGHKFLQSYIGLALKIPEIADESEVDGKEKLIDASTCEDNDNKLRSDLDKSISEIMNIGEGAEGSNKKEDEPSAKRLKLDDASVRHEKCRRPSDKLDYEKGPVFWGADWRSALCRCSSCMLIYKSERVEYLLDVEDSAKSYEERGLKKVGLESTYEQGIRALASIDRVHQVDVISEYNRMRDKLKDYLQTFVANKKVVTEEDINRFFSDIRNEKNTEVGIPHFCR